MNNRMVMLWKKGGLPVAAAVLLFAIWQVSVIVFDVEKWLLPAPSDIVMEGYQSWSRLLMHTWATLQICLVGFAAGAICGVSTAIAMHLFKPVKSTLAAILVITQNVPIIVLAPLLVVWFGFGLLPKVMVVSLVCYFPIAVSMMNGLFDPDHTIKSYMRMLGATRWQLLFKLEVPNSLPHLFSGLKISATYSVMGAVISEWLGASRGLGHFMKLSASAYRTDRVFAAVAIIIVLSIGFYALIGVVERAVIRWNPGRSKEEEL